MDLSYGVGNGCAERGEAVEDGDTDLELGNLTVEVPREQALSQQLDVSRILVSARLRW